ncbi:MAG: TetR/AcrR family transcriptional regulator [Desulfomicrobium sp.]|jgi:AcrR family transcriptional regulator|nr:TetR/AcrR family transcriptional regulator [Desulfomicrobium sp.]
MTKQQEKSLQTQQELLDSAKKLFARKGFVATTVSEITAEAGYAKGSFYRHWASKDEIMLKIIADKMQSYRSMRNMALRDARSLSEVMDHILNFLESMIDDRNWCSVFLEFTIHASRNEELRGFLNQSLYRLSDDIFEDIVGPYIQSGFPAKKIGALNTALFEGFLIHSLLGTGTIDREDFRQAAKTLALANALGNQS